jgi:hypothetical protein
VYKQESGKMTNVVTPNRKVIKSYLDKWKTLENYTLQERSLSLLFNKLCPKNNKIEEVLLKVSALNDFYSTNIFDTYTVSKHILDCRIDQDLKSGCKKLVNKIALVTMKKRTINFYSFASKYCSHHKPEVYPIYDSYVEKMLMYLKRNNKFASYKKSELKTYYRFIEIINEFKKFYNLDQFSLRELDIYLWLAGKKYFPNKY